MSYEFTPTGITKSGPLAERREALGLSQEQLARLLGVELSAVAQWERGTASVPPPSPPQESAGSVDVPRQLPASVPNFVGRVAELDALTKIIDEAPGDMSPGALVISAIGGTAGIGKTALALHWAHQVAYRFPDGQLHVNLRGFDPSSAPVLPADAIRGFLDALGVPPDRVPRSVEAQAGLYRSLLSGKRMLIVLDNARDEQQIRPLLPASPGSLVLVTSRSQIAGLAAAEGARIITLDTLTRAEAIQMLTSRLGQRRAADDHKAISEIATLCAGLPLALSIAAARIAMQPSLPLSALATELRDTAGRLDALDVGDPQASVRAVFSWSYQQLTLEAARMFRLMGLHPGLDIAVDAAARLAGVSQAEGRRLLQELAHGCLITEHVPGRYTFNDLLRAYASRQARTLDGEAEITAALGRVFDHYAQAACAAAILLYPSREMITFAAAQLENGGLKDNRFANAEQAQAWLKAEHSNLTASVAIAAESGFDRHAWQLPWFVATHLARSGYRNERITLHRTALVAAVRAGDVFGQAVSSRLLASAFVDVRYLDQALDCYKASAGLYQQIGDRLGEAKTWQSIATTTGLQGRYADAIVYLEYILQLQQEIGHKAGEARTLLSLGSARGALGDMPETLNLARRSLALATEIGNRYLEERSWHGIGWSEQVLGNFDESLAGFQNSLDLTRIAGDRFHEADVLAHLGDLHHAHKKPEEARESWSQALVIFDELQHPDADQIRAKIVDPGPPGSLLPSDSPFSHGVVSGQTLHIPWCSVHPTPPQAKQPTGDTVELRRPDPRD